jgi:hypothetical protein
MAMLLDGPPSTIEDLTVRDSSLLNVSATEGIDLTTKLQVAASDLTRTIESLLASATPFCADIRLSFPSLHNIAVTPQLKTWHTFKTLRLVYEDLYYSRLNDRYQAKMKLYQEEETQALSDLRVNGLGIVFDPLPQALAPSVTTIASPATGGIMYVGVTFVNQKGEEGLMSTPIEVTTQDGTAGLVRISASTDSAIGWNLYVGLSPTTLTRQNSQVLDPLAAVTIEPNALISGPNPGIGQRPNLLYAIPRRILRG